MSDAIIARSIIDRKRMAAADSLDSIGTYMNLSSTGPGVSWRSATPGSYFTVSLSPPLVIDGRTRHSASVLDYDIWFASPNVGPAALVLGNQFSYTNANAGAGPLGTFTVTLPQGLYALGDIQQELGLAFLANGHGTPVLPIFTLGALNGSQRVQIIANYTGLTVAWTSATNPMGNLLGFSIANLGPSITAGQYWLSDLVPNFPQGADTYVMNTTLVHGAYVGGVAGNAITNVNLDATPNSQIVNNSCSSLSRVPVVEGRISQITCWLTNQAGQLIVNNQPWGFSILIR